MKKTTHSLLITALILFCAGLLLAVVTSLVAKIAKIDVMDVPKKARTIESITVGLDKIIANSPESNFKKQLSTVEFTSVELISFAGEVKVCVGGEKTELVLDKANTNNLEYIIVGDTLTVREVDPVGFLGFYISEGGVSFKGLRHIFSPGNSINSKKTVTLKLAKDFPLDKLNITSKSGDVTVDGIFASTVSISSSKGKVTVKDLTNKEGKINIGGNFTDVEMKNNQYTNCAVSSHFGNITTHLLETTNNSTILDLWCGKVSVKTDLPTSHYKLSLETTFGNIHRNGEELDNKLTANGVGAFRISSSMLMADFEISFNGKDESKYQPKEEPEQTEPATTAQEAAQPAT